MAALSFALVLDWDDLRYFLAVSREGSLSRAAQELGVTQPTVGRRIAALQRRLGAKLFLSTASGQALSSSGRRLLPHAERMELEGLAAERATSGRDLGLRGKVKITASEWLIGSVLGPMLRPFLCANAELELELVADARHLSLAHREADIALRPSRFEQPDIAARELSRLSFGLYASDSYLAELGVPDFAEQCAGHRLLALSESMTQVPDAAWLPTLTARARIVARSNGREPLAKMAAAGIGIACLPRFLGDAAAPLRLLPTPGLPPERALWLGYHRDARAVPRLKATVAFLVAGFARLRPALCPPA
ncbi:MAG TPA: LysR family transcriptional regulator [Polyangiaceae bacterium]|nr:LysR family transcriptional regulator [Polyangiaceae bacterium]